MIKETINIIGLGYIGLPFALLLSSKGYEVIGTDIDTKKIELLKSGNFISEERDINKLYKSERKKSKIIYTSQFIHSDIFILCLPTPLTKNKKCDLKFIMNAINKIINLLKKNNTIIIESTVPIGTTNKIIKYVFSKRPDLNNKVNFCFIPEKAIPGSTIKEIQNNTRIIGSEKKIFNKIKHIYKSISKNKILNYSIEEAEASKLIENSFRDNQIAFSNFIDHHLKKKKLDSVKIFGICNKHPRVNLLNPSIGVGGHCIPIDPYFLNINDKNNMIRLARKINDNKIEQISKKIKKIIKKSKRNICFWGLGYKPGSKDLRESPAIKILKKIKLKKNHYITDPYYKEIQGKTIFKNRFIHPLNSLKKCSLHIVLNLEKGYIKKSLYKKNYIIAENI